MKRYKKLLAVGLSIVMMMCSSMMVFAAETTSTEDAIIAQAIALDENFNLEDYEFTVVALGGENSNARSAGENTGEKVIQTVETVDGVTKTTLIYPFKVLENGEIVNSFEYAENSSDKARSAVVSDTKVDITVTCTVDYETVIGTTNYYYRHGGVLAYWSTSGTTSSVHELNVTYRTSGSMYYFVNGKKTTKIGDDIVTTCQISEIYPEINHTFSAYNTTPSDRVYDLGSYTTGGFVTVEMECYTGGTMYTYRGNEHKVY